MYIYIIFCIIAGIVSYILFAVLTKKADGVVYGIRDKIGIVTNVALTVAYVTLSPLYLFLGLISYPSGEGFLFVIGWIISLINASTALACGVGLGLSVAFRKRGKSKLSFAIQFLGFAAITWTVITYCAFAGNLLQSLN